MCLRTGLKGTKRRCERGFFRSKFTHGEKTTVKNYTMKKECYEEFVLNNKRRFFV